MSDARSGLITGYATRVGEPEPAPEGGSGGRGA